MNKHSKDRGHQNVRYGKIQSCTSFYTTCIEQKHCAHWISISIEQCAQEAPIGMENKRANIPTVYLANRLIRSRIIILRISNLLFLCITHLNLSRNNWAIESAYCMQTGLAAMLSMMLLMLANAWLSTLDKGPWSIEHRAVTISAFSTPNQGNLLRTDRSIRNNNNQLGGGV